MHDGRPYAIIMQSFMRFRPVVSEEMMSKDFGTRCPEQRKIKRRKKKKDSKKSTKTIKIPKDSESLKKR
jgi:hypothetical protein